MSSIIHFVFFNLSKKHRSQQPFGAYMPTEKCLEWENERIIWAFGKLCETLVEKNLLTEQEIKALFENGEAIGGGTVGSTTPR